MLSKHIYLIEYYTSILGESTSSGIPASIIRLAGCNLRCKWCDTKYSLKRGRPWSINYVMYWLRKQKLKTVLITGGEPLMQPGVFPLIRKLLSNCHNTLVETNGTFLLPKVDSQHLTWVLDIKLPSSGMHNFQMMENRYRLREWDQIKFVIANKQDFSYALNELKKWRFLKPSNILFSPVYEKLTPKILAEWMLAQKLPYRLHLQLHKIIWKDIERRV